MTDLLGQTSISEVILIFVILFIAPLMIVLLTRLRRYEAAFGSPRQREAGRKKNERESPGRTAPAAANAVPADSFPYRQKTFLSPPERSCLAALEQAMGDQARVFPKVAVWQLIESTDRNPGYFDRMAGKHFDFLVCDARTGKPFVAAMFKPAKGVPMGFYDELRGLCAAAGVHLAFLPVEDAYDVDGVKSLLGIPEL